ncbi:aldo/keto reductase family protein [Ilyonectria destructans]|nr:aldo/keto reductase family protein [Ilyonectria destructans]
METGRKHVATASGTKIPVLGLGTFEPGSKEGSGRCATAVREGILAGYRHIDTASLYGCEEEVGEGIRSSGIPREELFICTKFWQQYHRPEDVVKSLDDSLGRMGLSYVDLYLMHWPLAFERTDEFEVQLGANGKPVVDEELTRNHEPTWRAMEALVQSGKARAIGVSNFTIPQLQGLLKFATIKPACNQVEAHPWFPQNELLEFCKRNGIAFVAYSPLGSQPGALHEVTARLLDDQNVMAVAKKNGVEPAQVLIAWAIQRGTVVIPKSATPSRIVSNFTVPELSSEDFDLIDTICDRQPSKKHRFVNFDEIWGVAQFEGDC